MDYKMALVGHPDSTREIAQNVRGKFKNLELVEIPFARDTDAPAAAAHLTACLDRLSGILFTRQDPYELLSACMDFKDTPVRYIDINQSSFVHALLEGVVHYHTNVTRVSVDGLDYDSICEAYRSIGVDPSLTHFKILDVDHSKPGFVESITRMHRENFQSGQFDICLTNIRSIYDTLHGEGVPIVLMVADADNYVNELRRLIVSSQLRQGSEETVVILRIVSSLAQNRHVHHASTMQSVLDCNKVTEIVASFATKLGGVFFRLSESENIIICNKKELASETKGFTHFPLLSNVLLNTTFTLSIGVGFGQSLRIIYQNATTAMEKALSEGGNRVYLSYSPTELVSSGQPVAPLEADAELLHDHRLSQAAQTCGLSLQSVMKINEFVRPKNNNSFTSAELAEALDISPRTASRIVGKLEQNGYLIEVGRITTGNKGRPTRVYRLMW